MAAVTFTIVGAPCAANNHAHITAALDGGAAHDFVVSVDELFAPWTQENGRDAVISLLRLYSKGKTKVQIRNALLAGLTVNI